MRKTSLLWITAILAMTLAVAAYAVDNATPLNRIATPPQVIDDATVGEKSPQNYTGYLRIYIVEPTSRYLDFSSRNYKYGCLAIPVNQSINISDGVPLTGSVTWNAGTFTPISQNNIMAVAAVFNSAGYPAYSYPPESTYPFTAHYCDAAARAIPGQTGIDNATGTYTHTVFLEEASRTTCQYCPVTRQALEDIDHLGTYQFIYVATLTDVSSVASYLFSTYNLGYTPTVYTDGGHGVFVGGSSAQSNYTSRITAASTRAVPELHIAVTLNFVSTSQVTVDYIVKTTNSAPSVASLPTGPILCRVGQSVGFSSGASDADGDRTYLRFKFDKDDSTTWMGPYGLGENATAYHTYTTPGTYHVSALSKDLWDMSAGEGDSLTVTVFRCGDADANNLITISDAVYLITYIFAGGAAPSPLLSGDADCNELITISDAVYLISYIFAGGPAPCSSCN